MELLPTGSLGGEDGAGDKSNPASPDDMPGGSNGKVYAKIFMKFNPAWILIFFPFAASETDYSVNVSLGIQGNYPTEVN